MTTPLTNLSVQCFRGPTWSAFYNALQIQGNNAGITGGSTLSSNVAPAAAFGIDTLFYVQKSIAASGTYTLDLNNYQDIAGNAACAMVRFKAFWVALLDSNWDATIATPASGITFGPGGVSNANLLNLADASDLYSLKPGEQNHFWTPSAAGRAVDGTHKVVTTINLDSVNAAVVRILFAGGLS